MPSRYNRQMPRAWPRTAFLMKEDHLGPPSDKRQETPLAKTKRPLMQQTRKPRESSQHSGLGRTTIPVAQTSYEV